MSWLISAVILLTLAGAAGFLVLRWGMRWGSTAAERAALLPGDEYLRGGPPARVAMTRAVSIQAPPGEVWPWITQMGRGAGWYSYDRLDNGGKSSARHLVSWIPEPQLGDATAIGYLRRIDPGRSLVWWVDGVRFFGARARLVVDLELAEEDGGSRLIGRYSADAVGWTAPLALLVFKILDSIMARRQFLGIRQRAESSVVQQGRCSRKETGRRDQYQFYEVLFAAGDGAGVAGKEHSSRWRLQAFEDGVLMASDRGNGQSWIGPKPPRDGGGRD